MSLGQLVILNGTSSAGKTMIGVALQDLSRTPFLLTGVDHYWARLPSRYWKDEASNPDDFRSVYSGDGEDRRMVGYEIGLTFRRMMYGLHRAVRALVEVGNNVIVDYVSFDDDLREDLVACWTDLGGVLVGVRPPLEVSELWEVERGARDLGQARTMFDVAHAGMLYDLVIDSSAATPEDRVRQILAYFKSASGPVALQNMRSNVTLKH